MLLRAYRRGKTPQKNKKTAVWWINIARSGTRAVPVRDKGGRIGVRVLFTRSLGDVNQDWAGVLGRCRRLCTCPTNRPAITIANFPSIFEVRARTPHDGVPCIDSHHCGGNIEICVVPWVISTIIPVAAEPIVPVWSDLQDVKVAVDMSKNISMPEAFGARLAHRLRNVIDHRAQMGRQVVGRMAARYLQAPRQPPDDGEVVEKAYRSRVLDPDLAILAVPGRTIAVGDAVAVALHCCRLAVCLSISDGKHAGHGWCASRRARGCHRRRGRRRGCRDRGRRRGCRRRGRR